MEDNENPLVHVDSLKLLEVKAGAVSDEWPRLQAKDSVENMLQAKDSVEDLMYGMDHLLRYMNRTLAKLEAEEPYCAAPEDECVTERKAEESLRSGITSCPDDNPKKELDVFGSQLVKKFNQLMEADHNWRVAANLLGCSDREAISCDDANTDLELDEFPTKDCQEDRVPTGASNDVTRSSAAVLAEDADSLDDLLEVDIATKMKKESTLQEAVPHSPDIDSKAASHFSADSSDKLLGLTAEVATVLQRVDKCLKKRQTTRRKAVPIRAQESDLLGEEEVVLVTDYEPLTDSKECQNCRLKSHIKLSTEEKEMGIIEEEVNETEVEEVPKMDERLPGYVVDEPETGYDWDLHLEEETRPSAVRFDDQMSTIQRLKEEAYNYYTMEEGDGEVDEGLTRTAADHDDEVAGEKCDPEKTVDDEGPWGSLCKQKAYWQLGPPHLCLEGAACSECESGTTTEDDLSSQNSGDEPGCSPAEKPATLVLQLHLQKDRVDVCYLLVGSLSPPHSANFTFRCIVLDMTAEGSGQSKRSAKHAAAVQMLREMVKQQKSNKLTKRITPFTEEELQDMSFLLLSGSDPRNFVGRLQHLCAKLGAQSPKYSVLADTGADKHGRYSVNCSALGFNAVGGARRKKRAKQIAAEKILGLYNK